MVGTTKTQKITFYQRAEEKVKISLSDILYIESQREYVKIVTARQEFLTKMSTHESLLPVHLFKRAHRSLIVSAARIESYTLGEIAINGITIPV